MWKIQWLTIWQDIKNLMTNWQEVKNPTTNYPNTCLSRTLSFCVCNTSTISAFKSNKCCFEHLVNCQGEMSEVRQETFLHLAFLFHSPFFFQSWICISSYWLIYSSRVSLVEKYDTFPTPSPHVSSLALLYFWSTWSKTSFCSLFFLYSLSETNLDIHWVAEWDLSRGSNISRPLAIPWLLASGFALLPSSEDGMWLPMWWSNKKNDRTCNPLTMECICPCTTAQQSVQLGKATTATTTVLTWGGSGVGSAVREGALASLLYHQSRNCRKKTPTERPVDRAVAAPCRTLPDNVFNQLRDLGEER